MSALCRWEGKKKCHSLTQHAWIAEERLKYVLTSQIGSEWLAEKIELKLTQKQTEINKWIRKHLSPVTRKLLHRMFCWACYQRRPVAQFLNCDSDSEPFICRYAHVTQSSTTLMPSPPCWEWRRAVARRRRIHKALASYLPCESAWIVCPFCRVTVTFGFCGHPALLN